MGHSITACLPACLSDFMPASLIVSACLAVPSAARAAEPVAVDPYSTRWFNSSLGAAADGIDRPRGTESSASSAVADRTASVVRPADGARHLVVTRPLVLAGRLELDSLEVRPGGRILAFGDLAFFCSGEVRVHEGGEIVGARGAPRGGHVVLHSDLRVVIAGTVQGGHGGSYGAHGGSVVLRAPETLIAGLVVGGDGLPGWRSLDGPGGDGGDGGHALCFGPAFDTTEHGTAELAGGAGGRGANGGVFATGAGAPGGRGGRGGSGGQVDAQRDADRPYVAECLAIERAARVLPRLGAGGADGWLGARLTGLMGVPELRGLLAWCFVPDCTANKGAQGSPHPGQVGTHETGYSGSNGGGNPNSRAADCANGIDGYNGANGSGGVGGGGGHGGAPTGHPGEGGNGGDAGAGGDGFAGSGGHGQPGGHCCIEPPGGHGGSGGKGGSAGSAHGGQGGRGGNGANGAGGCKGGDAGRGGNGGVGQGGGGGTGGDGGNGLYPGEGGGLGLTQLVHPATGGAPGDPGNFSTPATRGKANRPGSPGAVTQGEHGDLGVKGGPCPDLPGGGG